MRRTRNLRAVVAAALVCVGLIAGTNPAGAVAPAPFGIVFNATGTSNGNSTWTLMIGDSLVNGVGAPAFAGHLRTVTGRSTYVAASSGSSLPNWIGAGWLDNPVWGGPNLASLSNYVTVIQPRITVVALGSNDARIMTQSPGSYTSGDHFWKVLDIVNRAKASSRCVLLTTVANHWSAASTASVNAVNANIAWADANMPGVYVADWHSYSAGHSDWFAAPGDIHHSNIGKLKYAEYIGNVTKLLAASGQC